MHTQTGPLGRARAQIGRFLLFFVIWAAVIDQLLSVTIMHSKAPFLCAQIGCFTFFGIWVLFPLMWVCGERGLKSSVCSSSSSSSRMSLSPRGCSSRVSLIIRDARAGASLLLCGWGMCLLLFFACWSTHVAFGKKQIYIELHARQTQRVRYQNRGAREAERELDSASENG